MLGFARNASNQIRAFLYNNGSVIDLTDSLTDANASFWGVLIEARGINDLGQIVGYCFNNSGRRSFLLTSVHAVPEPETYAMFLAGLCLLGFVSRKLKA